MSILKQQTLECGKIFTNYISYIELNKYNKELKGLNKEPKKAIKMGCKIKQILQRMVHKWFKNTRKYSLFLAKRIRQIKNTLRFQHTLSDDQDQTNDCTFLLLKKQGNRNTYSLMVGV